MNTPEQELLAHFADELLERAPERPHGMPLIVHLPSRVALILGTFLKTTLTERQAMK